MLHASRVLGDCRVALSLLEAASTPEAFRVQYAGCSALLRTVGHVLNKVDREQSPQLDGAITTAWARWRTDRAVHPIFWGFIEDERNRVLKEYDPNMLYGEHMVIADPTGGHPSHHVLGPDLYVPVGEGQFAGEDVRDMIAAAIEWWTAELRLIEGA